MCCDHPIQNSMQFILDILLDRGIYIASHLCLRQCLFLTHIQKKILRKHVNLAGEALCSLDFIGIDYKNANLTIRDEISFTDQKKLEFFS